MQAEIAAYNILSTTAAITALVGAGAVGASNEMKIYIGRRRQTSGLPAISIEPDGIEPTDQRPDASGSGEGRSRLDRENVLVFSYGANPKAANDLAQAVRAALDKKTGATYNGVNVQSIQFLSEDYFDENTDPETYVYEHRYRIRVIR